MNANLLLTIDVDDDYGNSNKTYESLEWESIKYCRLLSEELLKVNLPQTFFVRFDDQIKKTYNSYTHIYDVYQDTWERIISNGNEIGFHSHLVRFENKRWIQQNLSESLKNIKNSMNCLQEKGIKCKSSRISGFPYHQQIIDLLIDSNISHDSSCFPGFEYSPEFSKTWDINKLLPFKISSSIKKNNLIEIPLSVEFIKMNYDKSHKLRYINPSYKKKHYKSVLTNFIKKLKSSYLKNDHIYNIILHPDEMNPEIHSTSHELYDFNYENVFENIVTTIEILQDNYNCVNKLKISDIR